MNATSCMDKQWIGSDRNIMAVSSTEQLGIDPPKNNIHIEEGKMCKTLFPMSVRRMILGLLYNASFKKRLANINLL